MQKTHPEAQAIIDALLSQVAVLQEEVSILKRTLSERDARIAHLEQEAVKIAPLRVEMAALEAAKIEAERKSSMNSSNSSKPPSTDPPWSTPKKSPTERNRAKRARKKQGAQEGHKGHRREMLPDEKVNEVVETTSSKCAKCKGPRVSRDPSRDPWRHQVADLVDGRLKVTEYRSFGVSCADCGHWTPAALPEGVYPFILGPIMTALVALLTGKYRLSKRRARELFIDLFGLEVSLGTISACEQRMCEALEKPMQEAESFIRDEGVVGLDETGHHQKAKLYWMWVAVSALVVVYKIAARRTTAVAKTLVGDTFQGIVVTDQHGAYNWIPSTRRQLCWAHLYRKFIGFSESKGDVRWHGKRLVAATEKMFRWWASVRDGTMERADFEKRMRNELIPRMNSLLLDAAWSELPRLGRACYPLYMEHESLWLFVDNPDVPPTNNASEQEIRDASIRRKTSFGTQSERGSRFLERILTVSATCRRQDRRVFAFLIEAYQAHLAGTDAPSLLPTAAVARG